jgi:prephenate dehydratase
VPTRSARDGSCARAEGAQPRASAASAPCAPAHLWLIAGRQALGQCSRYISERFPGAALVKMASTAAAAEAVARGDGTDVAIGCRVCVEMYDGLELVAQGIQQDSGGFNHCQIVGQMCLTNVPENYTRFFLLGTSQTGPLPPMSKAYPSDGTQRALLRIEALRSPIVTVLDVLAVSVEVAQIERRPSPGLSPFSSAYIVEVADADAKTEDAWRAVLDDVTRRVKDAGAEAMVLGAWRRNG